MKRILIVGEMNKLMTNMNDILSVDFQVQVCALDIELMTNMISVVKPDLIILDFVGAYNIRKDLYIAAAEKNKNIPILTLERKPDNELYDNCCETEQIEVLVCPIKKSELISKCCKKLGEEDKNHNGESHTDYILDEAVEEEKEVTEQKKHIFIVDDSPMQLRNIKSMLEQDYIISVANSGEQALKFIPKKKPDLILLDYEMPNMNGKETFEKLKEDEAGRNIPVVFLTGVADKQHIYAVLQLEPAGYVLKPPTAEKLISVVEAVLNSSEK